MYTHRRLHNESVKLGHSNKSTIIKPNPVWDTIREEANAVLANQREMSSLIY